MDKQQQVEKLVAKYDNETKLAKNGKNYLYIDLGELEVPKEANGLYLRVIPNDKGKNHLFYVQSLGLSEEEKQKRKQQREKRSAEIKKSKQKLKNELKDLEKKKKDYFIEARYSDCKIIDENIKKTKAEIDKLVIRRKK